jgi:cell cycle arrest protein BUB2
MSLERLLRDGPPSGDVEGALESTRFKVLDQGIKTDSDGMSSLRIYVWLILLNAPVLETDAYLALIHRGASPAYSKIRNDTFRTLTTDPLFRRRVSEASLIRLLNAIAWRLHDAREERVKGHTFLQHRQYPSVSSSSRQSLPVDSRPGTGYDSGSGMLSHPASSPAAKNRARALTLTTEGSETGVTAAAEPGTYVQGMNVLAAPFLYAARSEAEAFIGFHQLLTQELPGYIRGAMDGVHKGLALVDKVLAIVDPKLSLYLLSKNMSAEIYAFPSVLTLCACTPPLPEVLRLWDFLFAYGPHLNILCIVAQLVLIRTKIMESPRYVYFWE